MNNAHELVRRIAQNDESAFEALFNTTSAKMRRYAGAILGHNHADADEVISEAYMNIWRYAISYNGGNIEAWIRRIVRNKAIDFVRRVPANVIFTPIDTQNQDEFADDNIDVLTKLIENDNNNELKAAIDRLSFEHREVIVLCYFEEMSLKAIAELLDCPENTIKTRLYHARNNLKISLRGLSNDR